MHPKLQVAIIALLTVFAMHTAAQTSGGGESKADPKQSSTATDNKKEDTVQARIEKYLRNLYAWGPQYDVKIGDLTPSPISDLLQAPVTVSLGGQGDTVVVYVNKGGTFLIQGDVENMSVDPFAEVRAQIHVENSPSMGPENAKVTLVEFADFECPSCRQLDHVLRDYLPSHPEIRLVFKHFPLTQIHPWAMTAAIATQCTYQQNPEAFWKMHDAIFDAQEEINPSNVQDKMKDLAAKQGLNMDAYQTCISNPATAAQVQQNMEEGLALKLTGTPTTFVNGRRLVGSDESVLKQYIEFTSY